MNTDKMDAERIASEYAPKQASKVVALKKLDNKTKMGANMFGFTFGIIMALVLGIGMCLSMKVIGDGSTLWFAMGIIIGIIGLAGVSVNYPIYVKLLEKGKQKYGNDIIELAKQIAEEE